MSDRPQCLIGPVGGVDVRKLGDAGDLISGSRVIRNAVDVQLGGIGAGGQKAKGGRSHQQLLEKLHLIPHTGNERMSAIPDFEVQPFVKKCSLCRSLHRHVSATTVLSEVCPQINDAPARETGRGLSPGPLLPRNRMISQKAPFSRRSPRSADPGSNNWKSWTPPPEGL